jgi:osmotically-inducible protein OsmY
VHVDTNDGVVTLYGKVPSAEQRALAGQAAKASSAWL